MDLRQSDGAARSRYGVDLESMLLKAAGSIASSSTAGGTTISARPGTAPGYVTTAG